MNIYRLTCVSHARTRTFIRRSFIVLQPDASAWDRRRTHRPSWKLFECYTKVNFTLGFPPFDFTWCCFHRTRCIVGPICLITDDEGAISCLRWQDEERRRFAGGRVGELVCGVGLIPVGVCESHMFDPSHYIKPLLLLIHILFLLFSVGFELRTNTP